MGGKLIEVLKEWIEKLARTLTFAAYLASKTREAILTKEKHDAMDASQKLEDYMAMPEERLDSILHERIKRVRKRTPSRSGGDKRV